MHPGEGGSNAEAAAVMGQERGKRVGWTGKGAAKARLHALNVESKQLRSARDSGGEAIRGELGIREHAGLDVARQCLG